ncbi:DEAD-box ATP-dependent RNA helicase 30-like isoform X2 [Brassica napus]|uniref:DEAD-box ATP-dependent RNA helicase 30-like isoform X2 n=1 Tax=Brassica napus TaxID=3708 RepID=UPI0020792D90|nr:DEAD-box ATP-dependent RNA helicase 30-like isoform X2 [Brassica napus]
MATAGNKNINAKLVDNILNAIAKLGFTEPTPIQAQGWPMALKGEEPVSLTKRRFRSNNIEPIHFGKMKREEVSRDGQRT